MSYNLVNPTTGALTRVAGGTLYADNPIGSIIPFGSSTIPSGYLLCNGQAVSRTTYSELFAAIGTAFGEGDGSTTFNVPDLREATTKGAGLTGKTVGAHLDADGLAVGEFLDDQLQAHTHSNKTGSSTAGQEDWTMFATSQVLTGTYPTNSGTVGRFGATTEVKSVGVNYIIKAKHVGIPSDFIDAIDDAISDTTVDTVADGNMHPVTSNAVYGKLNTKQDVIETITVHADNWRNYTTVENRYADWVQGNIDSPTIPPGYIALRYFAEVSEVEKGHVDAYPTNTGSNGIPSCIGVNTDGQVTTCKLRLGAICIKL